MSNQEVITIVVPEFSNDLGKRLDLFLALSLPEYSRAFIKKTIESNRVFVNGEVCFKAGYKIKAGDKIEFPKLNFTTSSLNLEPSEFDLEIIYEDNDYLILNKPIGLTVHPANSYQKDTLVNKILARYKELPGSDLSRPGIVHRLDKDTSGIIAVAKSPRGLWWLSSQFAERRVTKKYISLGIAFDGLNNKLNEKNFEVEGLIARNKVDRKEFVLLQGTRETPDARFSSSKFEVKEILKLDKEKNLVFMEISPKTGRTHQIRVHQKSLGVPILGDEIYLSRKQKQWSDDYLKSMNLENRLYLHSISLSFENYDGKMYSFSTEVPKSFLQTLEYAKKNSN